MVFLEKVKPLCQRATTRVAVMCVSNHIVCIEVVEEKNQLTLDRFGCDSYILSRQELTKYILCPTLCIVFLPRGGE